MIDAASLPAGLLLAFLVLLAGYAAGSIPVAAIVGRAAGVDAPGAGVASAGPATVWTLAGPGPGLLALSGDLAKGLLPVAIGIVTWSWWIGWVAGLGALLGACWPAFGRLPGGRGAATLAGVAVALSPAAGLFAVLPAVLVAGIARLLGRNARAAAIATGIGVYPLLFLAEQGDPARLAALGVLYLVAGARFVTTRR